MSDPAENRIGRLGQFIDNGDGTATDVHEGLMWMREREVDKVGFVKAMTMAMRKEFAGYTDWRLPTITELKSIAPSGYLHLFKKPVVGYYWSCTKQNTLESYDSWYAIINSTGTIGAGNPVTGVEYVRLVRDTPRFTITTSIRGSGSGMVNISVPNAYTRHNPEVDGYVVNSIVTLIANPSIGSKFKRWHGSISGTDQIYTLTVDSERIISAEFECLEYSLDLKVVGLGCVTRSVEASKYLHDTVVSLTAIPAEGFQFKRWSGDARGSKSVCAVKFDTEKTITAEFVRVFPLVTEISGSGSGCIERSRDANAYIEDSEILLTAVPAKDSKFVSWHGDGTGQGSICRVKLNSAKTVSAEFVQLENFVLTVVLVGSGAGIISRNFDAKKYMDGTAVTLTARATEGSKFKCWHGDATGRTINCTVTMDSAKGVSAEFVQLESFPLGVTKIGTGSGYVKRSVETKTYFSGSTVTLSALAEQGSIFNGWHGDAIGLNDVCTVTMNSAMSISAEFEKMTIFNTSITAELGSVGRTEIKKGQLATIFDLTLRNKAEQQVRVKVPLTSYVRRSGQTSEQNNWVAELVNGSKGVTLSAGAFCEMGLVYFMEPEKGDKLYVNVEQVLPSARISFTFQCTSAGDLCTFQLINASFDNQKAVVDAKETSPAMANALKRIESLESTLAGVLLRLDTMQRGFHRAVNNNTFNQMAPAQTLSEVLAWLAEHDRITTAELRARLLPLDLLPSAVINELNERALDMVGELALEEVGDEIMISKLIMGEIVDKSKIDYL